MVVKSLPNVTKQCIHLLFDKLRDLVLPMSTDLKI